MNRTEFKMFHLVLSTELYYRTRRRILRSSRSPPLEEPTNRSPNKYCISTVEWGICFLLSPKFNYTNKIEIVYTEIEYYLLTIFEIIETLWGDMGNGISRWQSNLQARANWSHYVSCIVRFPWVNCIMLTVGLARFARSPFLYHLYFSVHSKLYTKCLDNSPKLASWNWLSK